MISGSMFWDTTGAGQPSFIANAPPFHPLTLLARALLDASGERLFNQIAAPALFAIGLISSLIFLQRFAANPNRFTWIALTMALAIAIIGDSTGALLPFMILLGFLVAGQVLKGTPDRRNLVAAGATASVLIAILLISFWWMPWLALKREARIPLPHRTPSADLPPFFFVERMIIEPHPPAARILVDQIEDFRKIAVVDHVPDKIQRMAGASLPSMLAAGSVELQSDSPGRGSLRVRNDRWALLVTREPWWPGWRFYWNEQRLPPVVVNAAFVGTFVPPGAATLSFRYRPEQFDTGLRVSAAGLLLFVTTAIWPWFLRIKTRVEAPGQRRSRLPSLGSRVFNLWTRDPGPGTRDVFWLPALRRLARPALLVLFAGYAAVLIASRVTFAGGSDSSGYLNAARLWQRGQLRVPLTLPLQLETPERLDHAFVTLGFLPATVPRTMVPGYPPGTSIHMALLRLVGGDRGPFFWSPLACLAAVLLMFALGRTLSLEFGWSIAGAITLSASAVTIYYGLLPLSDIGATTYAIAAMTAAFRARTSSRLAVFAGALLGIGVLVRPSQLLLVPAMALAVRLRPRALVAISAGAIPFGIAQMLISSYLFDDPFLPGYGNTGALFALENFPARFLHYSKWLALLFTPLVFPLSLSALGMRRIEPWTRLTLGVWFFSFFIFYCFFAPYGDWAATRFILPGVPALIALMLLGGRALLSVMNVRSRRTVALVALAAIIGSGIHQVRARGVLSANYGESLYFLSVTGAQEHFRGKPIVIALELSGAYFYYIGDTVARWDGLALEDFALLREHGQRSGRRLYALLSDFETADAFRHAPGNWQPLWRIRDVTLFEMR